MLVDISNTQAGVSAADGKANMATSEVLPVFDFAGFLSSGGQSELEPQELENCKQLAECLRQTGILIVRDPRVQESDNNKFIDLMERYFSQPMEVKLADARPELHYQVGVTPSGVEVPRCLFDDKLQEQIRGLAPENRAVFPTGPDAKWRFFWRLGPRPHVTAFPELNAEPVVPAAFPGWAAQMDGWGSMMLAAVHTAAEMAAVGFGLERDAFTRRMALGPHLLAPTGSDLSANGALGTVFAGYHFDLNFMTIHGRSRFPGLAVWLRDGRRLPVRVPDGCLILQAGKQLEWLTGGHVTAGMHEVVFTEETQRAAAAAASAGRSLWRVSSTVFSHCASDALLEPLGRFATPEALAAYPPTPAGEQVQAELEAINLKSSNGGSGGGRNSSGEPFKVAMA